MPRFVLQQHDTDERHFDLRLERGDRVATWALPEALPTPGDSHPGFRLEDRGPEVLDADEVEEARYGSGAVEALGRGEYVAEAWTDDRVEVRLRGELLRWGLTLVRIRGEDWSVTGRE